VGEHALREGLTRGVRAEIGGETEGLHNGQVSLDSVQGSTGTLGLRENVTTTSVENTIDTTDGGLRALDLNEVDGLLESGLGGKLGGVDNTTSGGDDLTTTTVDGISVQDNIMDVEADGTHVLIAKSTLLGGPGEGSDEGVLDLVQVLNGLGNINQKVGTSTLRTEAPDLLGLIVVPAIGVGHQTSTSLGVITRSNLTILNGNSELVTERLSSEVETVVLVGGLGQADLVGGSENGLTVGNDGVRSLQLHTTAVLLLEILEANLKVELTGTGNDVLTRLLDGALNERIRARETLKTFDKLGEIGGVLGLNGDTNDRRHGELEGLNVVSNLRGGDGTSLEDIGVNTNETDGVTGGNVFDGLNITTHHENGTLDRLDVQVLLLSVDVVGTHDANLLTSGDGTGENTTETVEATLIRGRNHLGDVEHERTVGVAVADSKSGLIVHGTLVQVLNTILLGSGGGRKVHDQHFQESLSGGKELLHNGLEQRLLDEITLLTLEDDVQGLEHLLVLLLLTLHDTANELGQRLHNELNESTLEGLAIRAGGTVGPLLTDGVIEVLTPKLTEELLLLDTELGGVHLSEASQGETPAVETRAEGNGTLFGVNLNVTEELVTVGGDDNVGRLDGLGEGLVSLLRLELKLQKGTIKLVNHENGLNTLTESLTQNGLSLNANRLNAVNNDKSTVGDTKSGSHFGGEVNVAGRVDQVDQELVGGKALGNLILGQLVVQGHTSGLDGDGTILLIGTSVGETLLSGVSLGDDTSGGDQRVSQSRLTVIHVSDNTHVTDVGLVVHNLTNLRDGEVGHLD